MSKREAMSEEQARRFDTFSVQNALTVESALDCGCEAYKDVFTYARSQAQGFQVQRGQHSIRIPVYKTIVATDELGHEESRKVRGTGAVFCRHQVARKGATVS